MQVMATLEKSYNTSGEVVPCLSKNYCSLYAKDTNWQPHKELYPDWNGNSIWSYKNDHDEFLIFITLTEDNNFPLFNLGNVLASESAVNDFCFRVIEYSREYLRSNAEKLPVLSFLIWGDYIDNDLSVLLLYAKQNEAELLTAIHDVLKRYERRRNYDFDADDYSEIELEILKFLAFCNKSSSLLGNDRHVKCLCDKLDALTPGNFEYFGIEGWEINEALEKNLISRAYFLSRINNEIPVAAFRPDYGIQSYMTQEDELFCWRNYSTQMQKQWECVCKELQYY